MGRYITPKINKKKISEVLREGKRLDGRTPFDLRDIQIETGISNKAEGSARIKIGKTEVIVGVKISTQEPYPDHDDEGTMMVGMEFSPACGLRYESGPPKMDSIEVSRVVDRGIRESGFIDWKKLCIKKGEKVWSLMIDIYCINDDGNVLDASALGVYSALKFAKLPIYDEKNDIISYGKVSKNLVPLTKNEPLSMTFYKIGDNLLFDPTRDEEDAADARLTLAVSQPNKDKIINSMQKGGLKSLSSEDLKKIVKESEKIHEKVFPDIEKKIKKLLK
jgi:exosome complex component RRP42